MNEKLDPLIFAAEGEARDASEPPPKTSWASGGSSAPPPSGRPSSRPTTFDQLSAPGSIPRVNTPRGILAPGSEFGVYRVGACIGEGGMARIYQAEHSGLQRQVALKVLIDGVVGSGEESRERFVREARIAAAIKHPNVVNIFDVGVHDNTPFLVMELLSGTDLESLIGAQGALDESFIVDIMIPIVAGLAAVHDAGVVHRDLKPGNIFLSNGRYEEIEPKLLDFGISKAAGAEQLRLTTNGLLMGTPFYMAPEGLHGEEMTAQSDQYSLGVVMYECATGQNPFSAPTFAEIFQLIGSATYVAPSVTRPQLSKRFERIILRAMSLDPTQRFADLRALGRELLLLAGQRTRVTWALSFGDVPRTTLANARPQPLATLSVPLEPAHQPERKRPLLLALTGVSVALFGVVLWLLARPPASLAVESATRPAAIATTPVLASAYPPPQAHAESAPEQAEPNLGPNRQARTTARPRSNMRLPAVGSVGPDRDLLLSLPANGAPASKPGQARTGANGAPIFD